MFRGLLSSVLLVARIIVMFKFIMLLWLSGQIFLCLFFMIFDMWMILMLPSDEVIPDDEDED